MTSLKQSVTVLGMLCVSCSTEPRVDLRGKGQKGIDAVSEVANQPTLPETAGGDAVRNEELADTGVVDQEPLTAGTISAVSTDTAPDSIGQLTLTAPANGLNVGETQVLSVEESGALTLSWSTSDPALAAVSSGGEVTGLAPGMVDIMVTDGTRSGTIAMAIMATGSCTGDSQFLGGIQPILDRSCLGCHANGGVGASVMMLSGPHPAAAIVLQNSDALKQRLDYADLENSWLLQKVTGRVPHGANSGPVLSESSADLATLRAWAQTERDCALADVRTNLVRSSAGALLVRLKTLFPSAFSRLAGSYDYVGINPRNYDVYEAIGLSRVISQTERPISPVGLLAMRADYLKLCNNFLAAHDGTTPIFNPETARLTGESPVDDPVRALALATARNVWLYPYKADAAEVETLYNLYQNVAAREGPEAARRRVCLLALVAPQFLLGNAGADDAVRRIALEVGRRVPKMADFEAYTAAEDKAEFLRAYTLTLQSSAETKAGFFSAVNDWHKDWLGLRPFIGKTNTRSDQLNGGRNGPTGLAGIGFHVVESDGFQDAVTTMELAGTPYVVPGMEFSEVCSSGVEEVFDPTTQRLRWEHWNPVVSDWEMVGEWVKNPETGWEQHGGHITLSDGTTKSTQLSDITDTTEEIVSVNGRAVSIFKYSAGALVGTPVDGFTGDVPPYGEGSPQNRQRRVRRFTEADNLDSEQRGFSRVKLWYSREEVRVCNTLSRFAFACAYRPQEYPIAPDGSGSRLIAWNPTINYPMIGGTVRRDSIAHPEVLESYACGWPNRAQIELSGTPAFNEPLAYPRSPDPVLGYNDLAYNMFDGRLDPTIADRDPDNYSELVSASPELRAKGRLIRDMRDEPSRLVEHILDEGLDYRQVLLASYTFGSADLELFYHQAGFYLPTYPAGFTLPWTEVEGAALRQIRAEDLTRYPLPTIASRWSEYWQQTQRPCLGLPFTYCRTDPNDRASASEVYALEYRQTGEVASRQMFGILTQPAFLAPVANNGGKARSIAARIFQRLMCGLPSDFLGRLDPGMQEAQAQFVPTTESSGSQHLDPTRGCFSCHISLDPLAAAINRNFLAQGDRYMGTNSPSMGGDLQPVANTFGYDYFYGVRGGGGESEGMLFGQPLRGIGDIAQVVANSREFAQCVVRKAYENVFGRAPDAADLLVVNRTTDRFVENYDYGKLIRDLITSPEFMREN